MSVTSPAAASRSPSQARSRFTNARTTATSPSSARIVIGHLLSRQICPNMWADILLVASTILMFSVLFSCAHIRGRGRIRARMLGATSRSRAPISWRDTRTCIGRRAWRWKLLRDRAHRVCWFNGGSLAPGHRMRWLSTSTTGCIDMVLMLYYM